MKHILKALVFFSIVFAAGATAFAAPLVLGRRYPLNTKAERGTLVWQFVTFNRSITGGISIQLEVCNARAKSLKFFDDYRDIVDESIQKNTISKYSMDSTSVNFSSDRYARVVFQVNKIESLYYLPVRVDYHDGFEDYLVRLYFSKGKFSLASRLLQQARFLNVPEGAEASEIAADSTEDAGEKKSSKKKKDKKKSSKKEDKKELVTDADAALIEKSAKTSEEEITEPSVKMIPVSPQESIAEEESTSQAEAPPISPSADENLEDEGQLSDILDDLPSFDMNFSDPHFQDPSDIEFEDKGKDEAPATTPETLEAPGDLDSSSEAPAEDEALSL